MFVQFFKQLIKKYWPIIFLAFSSFVLFLANYQPGTYLMGWDNTAPELNLPLNISRFFFGIWQEYRGLGTLDGMAHVANVVHWLYAALLSSLLGPNLVRYSFNMLAHLVGGIGMYILMSRDILPAFFDKKSRQPAILQLTGLFSGWVYMFNLMTVQMFYTPLELFSIHFAVLPWSILTLRKYLHTGTIHSLILFFLVNVLGVSQAHVPTIIIPYVVLLGTFLCVHLFSQKKRAWRQVIAALLVLIGVHAFWAAPYLYSTFQKSQEITTSKQNRLGTSGTFFRNAAWSDLASIATFGGFQLDYADWNQNSETFESIMKPWVEQYSQPLYQTISVGISLLSVMGVLICLFKTIRDRSWQWTPLIFSWLFVIVMLGTDVIGIREISSWLRESLPLFAQVFRFTFTKFSLLYVCLVSIFFGIVVTHIYLFLRARTWSQRGKLLFSGALIMSLLFISRLAFAGFFFYPKLRVTIPQEYFQLFNYTSTEQPFSRIASFPIHSLWGWTTSSNQWGYRGSGFIWQAIRQPLVDRSFDPWSKENETMFLQMNQALYRQDADAFVKTFRKYHTDLILYDQSIFHPGNYPENLFTAEVDQFFENIPEIQLRETFGNLKLFSIDIANRNLQPFIENDATILSDTYRSTYTSKDQAYLDHGDYVVMDDTNAVVTYPFSYLQQETIPTPMVKNNQLVYSTTALGEETIHLPQFSATNSLVPGAITATKVGDTVSLAVELQLPEIWLNEQPLTTTSRTFAQIIPISTTDSVINLTIGDEYKVPVTIADLSNQPTLITRLYIQNSVENSVIISVQLANRQPQLITIPIGDALAELDELTEIVLTATDTFKIMVPLGQSQQFVHQDNPDRGEMKAINCRQPTIGLVEKNIRLTGTEYISQNKGLICDTRYFPEISADLQYLFHWRGETVSGSGLRAQMVNPFTKRFDIDIISDAGQFDDWYTLYPSRNMYTKSQDDVFSMVLNGESYGRQQNKVLLQEMSVMPVPLHWLTSVYQTPTYKAAVWKSQGSVHNSKKLGTTFYSLTVSADQLSLLVLPQSFNAGWIAITSDNVFNSLPHYIYNGWANSWKIPPGNYTVLLIFWPQLLVYVGFGILVITGSYLIYQSLKSKKTNPQMTHHRLGNS